MNRNEARAHVRLLAQEKDAEFARFADRALELITDPDEMQQSSFGVCGMAAVVRAMLVDDDLQRFADLLDAVFRDRAFNGIAAAPGKLLAGRLKQWTRKSEHEAELGLTPPKPLYELDFMLSRALGKLLKERSPHVYELQLMTSEDISASYRTRPGTAPVRLFDLPIRYRDDLDAATVGGDLAYWLRIKDWRAAYLCGFSINPVGATVEVLERGRKWRIKLVDADRRLLVTSGIGRLDVAYDAYAEAAESQPLVYQAAVNGSVIYQKDGDLALDPDGIEAIMTKVLGAPACTWSPLAGRVDAAVAAINHQFTQPRPYVIGFVNGVDGWLGRTSGDPTAFEGPPAPTRRLFGHRTPIGEHIVAITGPIDKVKDHYHVPTWTWGESFVAKIPAAHLAGYLAGCSHGRL